MTPPIMRFCWFNGNPFHLAQDGCPVHEGVAIQHSVRYGDSHPRETVDIISPAARQISPKSTSAPAAAWTLDFAVWCLYWGLYDVCSLAVCYPCYLLVDIIGARLFPRSAQSQSTGSSVQGKKGGGSGEGATAPALLFIHGGGWVAVDSSYQLHQVTPLARAGFEVFSINYPHAPEDPFPAAILSTLRSLAWIKGQRGYRSCTILGESAGGNISTYVAALLANAELMADFVKLVDEPVNEWDYPKVDCVASWYGILDQHSWQGGHGPWSSLVRGMDWCLVQYRGQLDPTTPLTLMDLLDTGTNREGHLTNYPPALFVAGTADPLGLARSSQTAQKALERAGFDVRLLEYSGAHAFISFPPFVSTAKELRARRGRGVNPRGMTVGCVA
jgi:acetyl esterase/lipase